MNIESFVQNIPKVELHVHIEGTLTPELRWELAKKNQIQLPFKTFEELKATYTPFVQDGGKQLGAAGLAVFLEQYYGGMTVLRTASDFYELGTEYFRKALAMNVRHAEVFFDPQAHTRRGVPLDEVMRGLQDARQYAEQEFGISCNYILCFLRDMSVQSAEQMYEACQPYRHQVFCGIGLDSNEHDRPPILFEKVFQQALNDGLKVTSHCDFGQKNTHEHIRQVASTICGTGLSRIDHGLNAADIPELVELIKKRQLGMTLCPHAYNRRWPAEMVFPLIRRLFDAGIKITINSDDPTYMHNFWIVDNLQLVKYRCPFSNEDLIQLARNAIDICWAPESRKNQLNDELIAYQKSFSSLSEISV